MNLDLIHLIYKVPAARISASERALLLAVAASVPTLDRDGNIFCLEGKVKEPCKKRESKGDILNRSSDGCGVSFVSMFEHKSTEPFCSRFYEVSERNPVMRINDLLIEDNNLSISVLSQMTSYSPTTIRQAKHSLIAKGYLVYVESKNKQWWIVKAAKLASGISSVKPNRKQRPNYARPKVAALNKQRADERRREREEAEAAKRRALAEEEQRKRDEISWARFNKIPVDELRKMIKEGTAYFDEDNNLHID